MINPLNWTELMTETKQVIGNEGHLSLHEGMQMSPTRPNPRRDQGHPTFWVRKRVP